MSEKTDEDSVAVRYMKLVAEVHQDIANLKNGNEEKGIKPYRFDLPDSNGKHGTHLFNNSPAIRRLVVFLATEDLEKIEMTGRINDRPKALLEAVLQPHIAKHFDRSTNVRIQSIESEKKYQFAQNKDRLQVGFDSENNVVYYDANNVFESNIGAKTNVTQTVSKLLTGIVEAVKSVTEKNEDIKKSLTNEDGMAKDLVKLSDETKKNIRTVLKQCLEKKRSGKQNEDKFCI